MSAITWTTETRRLGDLVDWPKNPATISDHDAEHLRRSIEKFGLALPLIAQPNGDLIDGHQRRTVMALIDEYSPDSEVDVRVPSRPLSEEERTELAVRLRRNAGEWDWDVLTDDFDTVDLLDWGFSELELGLGAEDVDWGDAFAGLPDGDRAPFQQMTFTLHDEQVEQVKEALTASKRFGVFDSGLNQNSNGNALARICETYLTNGKS